MKLVKKSIFWVRTQFQAHTLRTLLVVIPALALITAGILLARGNASETFTYLPKRAYFLAETDLKEPETLEEFLHSSAPSVDMLLKNPAIAEELVGAQALTDIVDSRLALNNLKNLDRQLSQRLEEPPETVQTAELPSAVPGLFLGFVSQPKKLPTPALPEALMRQAEVLTNLKTVTTRLLMPPNYGDLVAIPATMNMKGVWQSPDEALLHLIPSGDWLPEQGYKLYREVNGQSELIAEELASPEHGLDGIIQVDGWVMDDGDEYKDQDVNLIQEMYRQAELTKDKLTALGLSAVEFRELAYRTDTLGERPRVSGELDFKAMNKLLLSIPAPADVDIEQRIPEMDLVLGLPIYIQGRQENGLFTSPMIKASLWEKFSVKQTEPKLGISALQALPGGAEKFLLAQEILAARQQLAALSFVDDEFAEAAGFLIRDDLAALNLPTGAEITYRVEAPGGGVSSLSVLKGAETNLSKPQGLTGYGVDGKVPLRWQQPVSLEERRILSGYFIERKLEGENKFSQVNERPIAVSYMLDETGVYFESPVFYEDTVDNGCEVGYRICSIDVFGRRSEYSEVLSLAVEKVTPPNPPSVETPVLSDQAESASVAVKNAVALNPGKHGVVLPIFTDSPDTVRFTIYRATAIGAKGFGTPAPIANLTYENPLPTTPENSDLIGEQAPRTSQKKLNKARQVLLANVSGAYPNLTYFDTDIEEGCTYKYWVSAWDSWNNESAWSQSALAFVPTDVEPIGPQALTISMHCRELPDYSLAPPGILHEDLISFDQLSTEANLPMRLYASDIVTATIKNAEAAGVSIGQFAAGSSLPSLFDKMYDNLPEERYIHIFLAVRGEDVLPDGTARLKWPAYSGDGLAGYAVYSPEFILKPLEEMQQMSRSELTQMGLWQRLSGAPITKNQLVVGGLDKTPGALSLFLICLEPKEPPKLEIPFAPIGINLPPLDISSRFAEIPEGGYVYLDWEASCDPQVKYYRVYRSEVPSFKEPVDETTLEWTLVGDHLVAPEYTQRVEQTYAHYYYYKVTSVSPWSVESALGAVKPFRVPSTKPPQTPSLLLPLSRKDGVQINFSAVGHCDRYEIYRTALPKVGEAQMGTLLKSYPELFAALFETPSKKDIFLTGMLSQSLKMGFSAAKNAPIRGLEKFKTLSQASSAAISDRLASLGDKKGLTAYSGILDELGPLALLEYRDLSEEMMKRVSWTKVGELPAGWDTVEVVDPATGLLKPLSIIDSSAVYGVTYLYTVQAWNDDNLGSSRAEPVEATPRRNGPFNSIDGLKGE